MFVAPPNESWMEDMTEEELKKIICPHCGSGYRVPHRIMGKTAVCKKCGNAFSACEPSPLPAPSPIGKLAVKYKLISPEQLQKAVLMQAARIASGSKSPLEDILLETNMLSSQHLQLLTLTLEFGEACRVGKEFCEFAVKKGVISQDSVEKALQKQAALFKESKTVKYMKDLLVEDGLLTHEDRNALVLGLASAKKQPGTAEGQEEAETGTPQKEKVDSEAGDEKKESGHPSASIKELESHCDITVAEDRMSAFFLPNKTFPEASAEDIRKLLAAHNISFGILEDSAIEAYLSADPRPAEPLEIAKGVPPEPGTDGSLAYYFSTNQKIGSIGAQGKIDFKDKGETPFVKQGDILIEKTPPKDGTPGTDVHGEPVPGNKPADVKIRTGSGTELSEDGLKAYAKVDGQPKLSFGGRLSVISDLDIHGDVDLKTGHVDFEGNVKVTGTVQSGFQVKSANLSAKEIMGADIVASGNITTTGGIIGATIHAQGDIRAKYIKNATITTYGDVIVEKEITDAVIKASGTCIVKRGKILSAEISAKSGIEAVDIGTDVSTPCRLTMGVDEHVENEIARLEAQLAPLLENLDKRRQLVDNFAHQQQAVHKKIAEMAQVQDRSLVAQRQLKEELASLPEDGENRNALEEKIAALGQKASMADNSLGELFDKQDKLTEDSEAAQKDINRLEEEIEELKHEKAAISVWAKAQKAVPVVKVSGAVFQGTRIKTPNAKTVMKETARHAAIREVMSANPDMPNEWEIKVQPL